MAKKKKDIKSTQDKVKTKAQKQEEEKAFYKTLIGEMLKLATSGFGLVAALAWNELIREIVNNYIKPFTPEGSGALSLFIYALIVTILAVTITYQLSKLSKKF
jgi:hypothetical protein